MPRKKVEDMKKMAKPKSAANKMAVKPKGKIPKGKAPKKSGGFPGAMFGGGPY